MLKDILEILSNHETDIIHILHIYFIGVSSISIEINVVLMLLLTGHLRVTKQPRKNTHTQTYIIRLIGISSGKKW